MSIPPDKLAEFDGMWTLVNLEPMTDDDRKQVNAYLVNLIETSRGSVQSMFMAAMKVFVDKWEQNK